MMAFPTHIFFSIKPLFFLYFLSFFILGFSLISSATKLRGNDTDIISLLEIKKMIKDDPFGVMVSWNETNHFCEWYGVSCGHRHQRVTSINLEALKLVRSLSSHIGNLSFLKVLDLRNNSFSSDIPQTISHLHRLQVFLLSNNSLSGVIPPNISACRNLKSVDFSYNNLGGNIPEELGTLTNLKRICFGDNNLIGKIPHFLGNLSLLYAFYVTSNNLLGEIPDSLCRLPRLQYFAIGGNNFSGTIPSSLFNHSSMLAIDVGVNYIEGTLPPNLFNTLPCLFFSIYSNNFTGSIPVTLSNATNMQHFFASSNRLIGKVPDLGNLKKLQRFVVRNNHLGEGGVNDLNFISSLINDTRLEVLGLGMNSFGGCLPKSITNLSTNIFLFSLVDNQVSGNIPREISNLIGLEILMLSNNKLSGEIPPEIGFLSNLRVLFLHANNLLGKIRISFGNLTFLLKLSLRENYLHGNVPASLGECQNLELLDLAQNNLTGYIPKENFQLSSLSLYLDLSYNQFVGSIPKEVGYLKNLGILDLSYNSFSGRIPTELGSCVHLETLNLTNNNLQGPIPSTLANLRGLQFLELSNNNLTGKVIAFLKDFKLLQNLNLSYNDFEGAVPTTGIFNDTGSISITGNRKLCGGIPELNLPECHTANPKKKKPKAHLEVVISLVLGIVGLTLVLCIFFLIWLRGKRKEPFPNSLENSMLRVSYHSLLKSTNGFSSENLLGVGGFGAVYKGSFDHDGTIFAVKVLDLLHHGASRSFVSECEVLKNTRHRNLVKVLTACSGFDLQGNDFKALVYEYMDNGSLDNWLHFSPQGNSQIEEINRKLSFVQRLNILIDVACALDYLHNDCEPAIIHCDLKPSNVLLDENMTARVSDFGLARFVQQRIQSCSISSGLRGTVGYAPLEYGFGSKPSKAGDIYSFGILILVMLTGRRPTDELFQDGLNLHDYAKDALPDRGMDIVDPKLLHEREDNVQVCLVSMITIGVACSLDSPADRMSIHDVVGELNKAKKSFNSRRRQL